MKLSSKTFCNHSPEKFVKVYHYKTKPKYEKNYFIKGNYQRFFYKCKICGHFYAKHGFKIGKLYSKQYLNLTYKNLEGIQKRFDQIIDLPKNKSDNKNRAERVNRFFSKDNLSLLDVGSGIGVFIFEMRKKKWDVKGVELDKRYVDFCKDKHGLNIYQKNLSKIKSKNKFDLVTLNKVLEHVSDPVDLLKLSSKFLNKKGILYIEVPDVKASDGGKHRQEFCIDHLHVFSKSSFKILAEKSGLKTLICKRIQEPSGKYTIYGFLKKKII